MGVLQNLLHLCLGDNIGQAFDLRRLDQAGRKQRLLQHVLVIKLQAIKIEFDRGP
jgi:hypothetical protein